MLSCCSRAGPAPPTPTTCPLAAKKACEQQAGNASARVRKRSQSQGPPQLGVDPTADQRDMGRDPGSAGHGTHVPHWCACCGWGLAPILYNAFAEPIQHKPSSSPAILFPYPKPQTVTMADVAAPAPAPVVKAVKPKVSKPKVAKKPAAHPKVSRSTWSTTLLGLVLLQRLAWQRRSTFCSGASGCDPLRCLTPCPSLPM